MVPKQLTGTVFDIQGFSLHDGPGCRTLIFFKGCPLSCRWCSNPEGKNPFAEPLYQDQKCTFDRLCMEACRHGAITLSRERLLIDRTRCQHCRTYDCAEACCTGALQRAGSLMTVDALYRLIQRDRQYWGSRGGITLTGGEPFFQPGFALDVLKRCHDAYIHTAAETCGDVPRASIEPSLPYLDWLFYDLKHLNPDIHETWTGHSNRRILANAKWISQHFHGRMVFRMTVVPGFNDDPEHIAELARWIRSTGRHEINLLPLHHLGREKYRLTGRSYYTNELAIPSHESMNSMKDYFEGKGILCYTGSETPF